MNTKPISFFNVILAELVDEDAILSTNYVPLFSDLDGDDLRSLEQVWDEIPVKKKRGLMFDVMNAGYNDLRLRFDGVCRLAINDNDSKVRLAGVQTISEYSDPEYLTLFINLLEHDQDLDVRKSVARAMGDYVYLRELDEIGDIQQESVEECLLMVYNDTDQGDLRRFCLESLGYSSRKELKKLITNAYQSNDSDWIASAVRSMGNSADNRWRDQVSKMLDHSSPIVRSAAVEACGNLEISEAVPQIIDLLEDPDPDVVQSAVCALAELDGEGVREALEGLRDRTPGAQDIEDINSALDHLDFHPGDGNLLLFDCPDFPSDEE